MLQPAHVIKLSDASRIAKDPSASEGERKHIVAFLESLTLLTSEGTTTLPSGRPILPTPSTLPTAPTTSTAPTAARRPHVLATGVARRFYLLRLSQSGTLSQFK